MTLMDSYKWICIRIISDEKLAYEIERVFYQNKLPIQIRAQHPEYAVWVPMKYKALSMDVLENFLIGNLAEGMVNHKSKADLEEKIYIERKYERKVPAKFYFFLLVVAFFLFLLRMTYGIDFYNQICYYMQNCIKPYQEQGREFAR